MTRDEYELAPKLCLHCGAVIPFKKRENKFCNSSCAASYNNIGKKHSEEHKAAISASVKAYNRRIGKVSKPKVPKVPKVKLPKVRDRKQKIKVDKPPRKTNALVAEKENFDLVRYRSLYAEVKRVVGIYVQTHLAKPRIILIVELESGKKQTRSYPRAIMELYLGRVLDYPEETVDHINSDPMDNRLENLQIVSRDENIRKAHRDGLFTYNQKGIALNIDNNGSKNGMSKISEDEVLRYRREYTSGRSKKSIIAECGLERKTVENFLFGRSYKLVPEKCEPRPYERST